MENTPLTVEKFTEVMRVFGDRMDARFDSMDKKFDEKFKKVDEKFKKVDERFDLCATKEQFKLLESGISEVNGRLASMENNMKAFVVREELKAFPTKQEVSEQIDAKLKGKRIGGLAVADKDQEYDNH